MKNTLFSLIESNKLTKSKLDELIESGCDLDQKNEDGLAALGFACKMENFEVIDLLLNNDEYFEDFETISIENAYQEAYYSRNNHLLSYLLSKSAQNHQEWLKKEGKDLAINDHATQYFDQSNNIEHVVKSIKKRLVLDNVLKKYPELLKLVDSINYTSIAIEYPCGNGDDKIECALVEIEKNGVKHQFDYMKIDNWSFAVRELYVKWCTRQGEQILLNLSESDIYEDDVFEKYVLFKKLALDLELGHLTFEAVLRFFSLLFSRTVQTFGTWENKALFSVGDTSDFGEEDFIEMPIKDFEFQ